MISLLAVCKLSQRVVRWCVPSEGANEGIYVVTLFCLVPLYPYQSASLTHRLSVQRPVQYDTLRLEMLFLFLLIYLQETL